MRHWDRKERACPTCGRIIRGLPGFMKHIYPCAEELRQSKGLKPRVNMGADEVLGCLVGSMSATGLRKALMAKGCSWNTAKRGIDALLDSVSRREGDHGAWILSKTARGGGWLLTKKAGEIDAKIRALTEGDGVSVPDLYAQVGDQKARDWLEAHGINEFGVYGEWEMVSLGEGKGGLLRRVKK